VLREAALDQQIGDPLQVFALDAGEQRNRLSDSSASLV
jgi:hypothetical protein